MRRGIARGIMARIALVAAGFLLFAGRSSTFFHSYSQDTALISLCQIQGRNFHSSLAGQAVRTQGVVYADLDMTSRRGFYIQAENCDGDPATSDGLFVYLAARQDVVKPGDRVEVSGLVQEYFGMTEISAVPTDVHLLSSANPLPTPIDLSLPFENQEAVSYLETLEGMYVKLPDALVVGPTDTDDRTWVVRADLGIDRVYPDDPAGTGEILCIDDGGLFEVAPEAKVGDRVLEVYGALDYSGGLYCLELVSPASVLQAVQRSRLAPEISTPSAGSAVIRNERTDEGGQRGFSIATFNLADLFDTTDDPGTADTVLSAAEYQRRLQKRALAIHAGLGEPEILAVQEVENQAVLQALLARPEIVSDYSILWLDGPDERGIDVAVLARSDRVQAIDFQARQGCTQRVDGFGPDGNRNIDDPQNLITCDTDGDGRLDGNRLFSRPPLVAHLKICGAACSENPSGAADWTELWLIANHFKSKVEDGEIAQYTLNRRIEEASFVAGLAGEILARPGANLVILGDLNDHPTSQPLQILAAKGLRDPWGSVPKPGRYSYIYHGVSQVLDYTLLHLNLPLSLAGVEPIHINADYPAAYEAAGTSPYRSSDHDLLLTRLVWMDHLAFLPLISTK